MTQRRKDPEFVVFRGPMASGKSSSLLQYLDRCKYQRKQVIGFKPSRDDRFESSSDSFTTHTGHKYPARAVESGDDVVKILAEADVIYDVIAVDEAFMIPGIADTLAWAFRSGMSVVVATLDMSFSCTPFSEVKKMLPWATRIESLTAACDVCGEDARYTYRKEEAEGLGEIAVGGLDIYSPRCFSHHPFAGEINLTLAGGE
jgi:thymidine kinase